MVKLYCDIGETELHAAQVLGADSPLRFDENGLADVDEDVAEQLVRRKHVHYADRHPDASAEPDAGGGGTDESEPVTDESDGPTESPPIDPADHTVDELRDALDDADYDWNAAALRGLLDAEREGKGRDTATDAIQAALNDHADEEE